MEALHVRLEGVTASFRHPLILSGTQASLPVPALSSLLGMISACAGRWVSPAESRIAFEYSYSGTGADLQTTRRWKLTNGRLSEQKVPGIARRQFHIGPALDLYLTGTALRGCFEHPAAVPRFGRSEDLAWVVSVGSIGLEPRATGWVGPTLIRDDSGATGLPLTLVEWFREPREGRLRQAGAMGRFVALPPAPPLRFEIEVPDLYHPSDAETEDAVVYLHQWSALPEPR